VDLSIVDIFRRHSRFLAKKAALIDDGAVSYAELWAQAGAVAHRLSDLGLAVGDRVGVAFSPSADFAILVVGLLRAGLVAAPVNTRLSAPEVADYLERLTPRAVIADESHLGAVEDHDLPQLVASNGPSGWSIVPSRRRASIAAARGAGKVDDAFVIGTGGTTGVPKGAVFSRAAVCMWALCGAFAQQLQQSDVELFGSPFFHSTILTGLLTPLAAGCTVRIIRHFDAESVLEAIQRDGGTRLAGAPTMLNRVLDEALESPAQWKNIRVVQFGSTKCPPDFVERLRAALPHSSLITGYGTTEYGPVTRVFTPDFLGSEDPGVGRPVPAADVSILAPGQGILAQKTDVEGEIVASCPWQMDRYIGNDEETANTILVSGHIRSGDIGRFGPDGYLRFVGRYKDIIITGGENVFPSEVEAVVSRHPAVADVAIYGVEDEVWGERIEAAIVPRAGRDLSLEDLREFCRPRLAGFKIPKTMVTMERLPLTSNMKVDRLALSRGSGVQSSKENMT
jgi:fatty-acyl-CoA synthase